MVADAQGQVGSTLDPRQQAGPFSPFEHPKLHRSEYADSAENAGDDIKQAYAGMMMPPVLGSSPPVDREFLTARQLHQQGQLADAARLYQRVLERNANHADALNLYGVLLRHQNNFELAEKLLRKAALLKPNFPPMHTNLGNALFDLKKFNDALNAFSRAIQLEPNNGEAYYNRGNCLQELERYEEAGRDYERALNIYPDDAEIYLSKGNLEKRLRCFEQALVSCDRAIELKPDYAEAYYNRGAVLLDLRRLDEALTSYDRAIKLNPDYAESYWNKSLTLLLSGNLQEGWRLYEWRWKNEALKMAARDFVQPLWLGPENISGKTILLHSEQGLGDTLQFCRYAALVKARGARVLLQVQKPLIRLLRALEGVDIILGPEDALPHLDCHCPLLSLPLAFQTDIQSIPKAYRYLDPDKILQEKWAARLGSRSKPRIGLAWSGNPAHENDRNRSLPLEQILSRLPAEYEYFCLQKDVRDQDLSVLGSSNIRRFSDKLTDFAETAALCDLMDLVISVDTSVAHLAGALGKPTCVLLPYIPDWRWLLDREDSPWYPTMRLFRQERAGGWDGVLAKVGDALNATSLGEADG